MHPSSYTYGVRGLIKGRWGGGSFLFLYIVGPILDLSLLSFCFWGSNFGGTLDFWRWVGGGGGIWVSHEYGFGVGVFFLSVSSLISLGLILGIITITLCCLFSLPESLFSP